MKNQQQQLKDKYIIHNTQQLRRALGFRL